MHSMNSALIDFDGDGHLDVSVTSDSQVHTYLGAESYCSTSPNSAGLGALIAATGSFHVEVNDLRLTATGLPPNEPGLFFCGDLEDDVPFEGGTLCVGSTHGLYRILPARTSSAAGVATIHLDLTLRPFDEEWSTVLPGSTWSFQYWYRDAAAPAGSRVSLSDAVRVQFCP